MIEKWWISLLLISCLKNPSFSYRTGLDTFLDRNIDSELYSALQKHQAVNLNSTNAISKEPIGLNAVKAIDWSIWKNFLTPLEGNISEQCRKDSMQYITQLNSNLTLATGNGWAYKMFDASAKLPPSGFLQGNLKWFGSFKSCLEVKAPTFKGKHCLLGLGPSYYSPDGRQAKHHKDTIQRYSLDQQLKNANDIVPILQMLQLGRCIPDSCSKQDLKISFTEFLAKVLPDLKLNAHVYTCHTEDEEIEMTGGDWAMISIISVFGLLILVGTFIDVTVKYLNINYTERLVQVFQGFSMYTNIVNLFTVGPDRPDTLSCINGIRFISMTWVLFGHAYSEFQSGLPVNNLFTVYDPKGPIEGSLAFQAILNAFPSVDSFFFIGATLLSYLTLKQLDKTKGGNLKFWFMFYVHRYIRLTSVYAMIIGLVATLLKFFETGPQSYLVEAEVAGCRESWWYNLLYINNFQMMHAISKPLCVAQTWYLANDMQFFIISPIFIYTLWRSPIVGLGLSAIGVIVGTVVPAVLTYQNNYPLSMEFLDFAQGFEYFTDFYVVPWTRFQPYICGLIFGYMLHRMKGQEKLKMNPYFVIWVWAIMGVVGAEVIYGLFPYVEEYLAGRGLVGSMAARVAYNGLHRLAWSICLGWVILACVKGAGGPINTILSWPAWVPLARLSYCIYLVHLTMLKYFSSIFTFSVTFSHTLGLYYILAMLCFSIFVAFIMYILFEIPMAHLEKILFASLGIGQYPVARRPLVSNKN